MSTFGNTSIGGSSIGPAFNDNALVSQFTAPGDGLVTKMTAYLNTSGNFKFCVYADNGSDAPGSLLASTGSVAGMGSAAWIEEVISLAIISGTKYWLGIIFDGTPGTFYYDSSALFAYKTGAFASPPNPFGTPDGTSTVRLSVYATYTPTGNVPGKVFFTSGTTFSAPADWPGMADSVECIGGGGGGAWPSSGDLGLGGGGGAYSKAVNVAIANGDPLHIGAGGTGGVSGNIDGTAGGDTYLGASLGAALCGAKGGGGAVGGVSPGTGGASGSGVGSTKYSGGDGGAIGGDRAGSGGGGAAGPGGAGKNGGASVGNSGSGGGGAGGGSATNGADPSGGTGGAGGAGPNGTGGGAAGVGLGASGSAGTDGGGGGGGGSAYPAFADNSGGSGGAGTEWDATHGAGGGGGAPGFSSTPSNHIGGNGGNYGGGGGGAGWGPIADGAAGNGAQGIMVITYTPVGMSSFVDGTIQADGTTITGTASNGGLTGAVSINAGSLTLGVAGTANSNTITSATIGTFTNGTAPWTAITTPLAIIGQTYTLVDAGGGIVIGGTASAAATLTLTSAQGTVAPLTLTFSVTSGTDVSVIATSAIAAPFFDHANVLLSPGTTMTFDQAVTINWYDVSSNLIASGTGQSPAPLVISAPTFLASGTALTFTTSGALTPASGTASTGFTVNLVEMGLTDAVDSWTSSSSSGSLTLHTTLQDYSPDLSFTLDFQSTASTITNMSTFTNMAIDKSLLTKLSPNGFTATLTGPNTMRFDWSTNQSQSGLFITTTFDINKNGIGTFSYPYANGSATASTGVSNYQGMLHNSTASGDLESYPRTATGTGQRKITNSNDQILLILGMLR